MVESDLNRIINASFKRFGFSHKISDGVGGVGVINPFDGFGVYCGMPIYYEAKLIKKGMFSFNFNKIETHQYENLKNIDTALSETIPNKYLCIYPIGFYKTRDFFRILFFSHSYINYLKQKGINSIKKKDLEKYVQSGNYLDIKYEKIKNIETGKESRKQYIQDLDRLCEVVINVKTI